MNRLGFGRRGRTDLVPAPFVVGVGRSGTTLLRLMLDAHPELTIPAETQFVPAVIESARRHAGREAVVEEIISARNWGDFRLDAAAFRDATAGLDGTDAGAVLRVFYSLCARTAGKPRWGEKTPAYVRHMREIGQALEEARFIHLIRDGRDVAISRRRRGMGAGKPMADTARLWRDRIKGARRQAKRLRGRYLELRYEDLVTDPEAQLRRVCELCRLEFSPAMLDYHRDAETRIGEIARDLPGAGGRLARSGAERAAAHALTARPPTAERSGSWRTAMSAGDQAEFESVAGELLRDLGYLE